MTPRPTARQGAVVALLTSLVLLVSGCFAAEMNLTINDDDADVAYTLLVDVDRLVELAGALGSDLPDLSGLTGEALIEQILEGEDPCADIRASLPDREVTVSEVAEGGRRGVRCTVVGVPFDALSSLGDDTAIRVLRDGSTTAVEVDLTGVEDLTSGTDQLGAEVGLAFEDLYEIRFVVTAQGTLSEHNATSTEGATAVWLITPDAAFIEGGTASMRATWTAEGDGGGAGLAIAAVIAVAVLGTLAVVGVVLRRRSSASRATPLPPPPPPYTGGGA